MKYMCLRTQGSGRLCNLPRPQFSKEGRGGVEAGGVQLGVSMVMHVQRLIIQSQ